MSEYQYYEFQSIDRPLSEEEQSSIARLSSRVELTPHHAIFTYSYGDFPGNAKKVLEKYFDAMLYLANWGTKHLAFRFPRSLVDRESLAPYCVEDIIVTTMTDEHVLLDIRFFEEGHQVWVEGEGLLSSLASLRKDILHGDFRVLYLAWLATLSVEENDEAMLNQLEPPVPANLQNLSTPLKRFIDLFEIDNDLIDAAAEISPKVNSVSDVDIEKMIIGLPESEKNGFLGRLMQGEPNLDVLLMNRLRSRTEIKSELAPQRRVAELLVAAQHKIKQRKEKRRQEAEQARLRKFEELRKKEPMIWNEIMALIEQKKSKAYDESIKLLLDLRELAEHLGEPARFKTSVDRIYEQYHHRSGLTSRLRQAKLKE